MKETIVYKDRNSYINKIIPEMSKIDNDYKSSLITETEMINKYATLIRDSGLSFDEKYAEIIAVDSKLTKMLNMTKEDTEKKFIFHVNQLVSINNGLQLIMSYEQSEPDLREVAFKREMLKVLDIYEADKRKLKSDYFEKPKSLKGSASKFLRKKELTSLYEDAQVKMKEVCSQYNINMVYADMKEVLYQSHHKGGFEKNRIVRLHETMNTIIGQQLKIEREQKSQVEPTNRNKHKFNS